MKRDRIGHFKIGRLQLKLFLKLSLASLTTLALAVVEYMPWDAEMYFIKIIFCFQFNIIWR